VNVASRHPPAGSRRTVSHPECSRYWRNGFDVGDAPNRTTTSGEASSAETYPSYPPSVASPTCGPNRCPERGSAATGKPLASASADSASGVGPPVSAGPRTMSPLSAASITSAIRSRSAGEIPASPWVTPTNGPDRPAVAGRSAAANPPGKRPVGDARRYRSGVRRRFQGFAERHVEVDRSRLGSGRGSDRTAKRRAQRPELPIRRLGFGKLSVRPDRIAVEPLLIDRLVRAAVGQFRGPIGRQKHHGTRAESASTTAGWKFASAVPEVQTSGAGRPVRFA